MFNLATSSNERAFEDDLSRGGVAYARGVLSREENELQTRVGPGAPSGIREEDLAVQESMGGVCDRTTEHLGSADLAVIAMRRRLLEAVRALAPYEAHNAESYRVRSAALVLPRTAEWHTGAAAVLAASR
jgi:hypothetical protein